MRTVRYFGQSSLRGIIYIARCSECGDLAERNREDEVERICLEHTLMHISQDSHVL